MQTLHSFHVHAIRPYKSTALRERHRHGLSPTGRTSWNVCSLRGSNRQPDFVAPLAPGAGSKKISTSATGSRNEGKKEKTEDWSILEPSLNFERSGHFLTSGERPSSPSRESISFYERCRPVTGGYKLITASPTARFCRAVINFRRPKQPFFCDRVCSSVERRNGGYCLLLRVGCHLNKRRREFFSAGVSFRRREVSHFDTNGDRVFLTTEENSGAERNEKVALEISDSTCR